MKMSEVKCSKCGQNAAQAADRGAYLERVSPEGLPSVWQCSPTCEHKHGNQDDALLAAISDSEEET